mgnify:CR=1 FL=1
MKKRLIALGLAAALCASVVTAWATGGSAGENAWEGKGSTCQTV